MESLRINYWSKKRKRKRDAVDILSQRSSSAAPRDDCGENSQQRQKMNCYYTTFSRKLLTLRKHLSICLLFFELTLSECEFLYVSRSQIMWYTNGLFPSQGY